MIHPVHHRLQRREQLTLDAAYTAIGLIVVELGGLIVRSRDSQARLIHGGGPGHLTRLAAE
ncbi:predicted protein [Streptomyces viridochromogenes DSM 40736]|uniref:Predicted protein n=1 Tax=Streptomyces viridochromogenes (strain DSM 40736 / JCM 4977 / BCRC 1201 / Tue 494) TaxID=591159 RepID=D9XAB9_STRVT|nr:hypothetical protein [Streptomyces viridochromogenes]EFL36509.1 predicted protein [Streptomyces viridochromogenes DSM 40736]